MIQTSGNWFRGINVDIKTIQLLNYHPDIIDSEIVQLIRSHILLKVPDTSVDSVIVSTKE